MQGGLEGNGPKGATSQRVGPLLWFFLPVFSQVKVGLK